MLVIISEIIMYHLLYQNERRKRHHCRVIVKALRDEAILGGAIYLTVNLYILATVLFWLYSLNICTKVFTLLMIKKGTPMD